MTSTTRLTERRAADRKVMAAQVEALATELGATVTRPDSFGSRDIRLSIETPHGCTLSVDFDGDNPANLRDVHVLTWNVASDSLYAFAAGMGSVNPCHFAKASRVTHGLDALLWTLERDIPALIDGRYYDAGRAHKRANDRLQRHRDALAYIAPLVACGEGLGEPGEPFAETAEELRHQHDVHLPALIAQLDAFIAVGCSMDRCTGFPWR